MVTELMVDIEKTIKDIEKLNTEGVVTDYKNTIGVEDYIGNYEVLGNLNRDTGLCLFIVSIFELAAQ